jgi:PAS domain S-box-containing protein
MPNEKKEFKILVIEDNPDDYALVEENLLTEFELLTLVHAKNYHEASEILSKKCNQFDVILLDLTLPDKKGIPLIKQIAKLCSTASIIVLTGYTNFSFGIQSLSLGVSDYLIKDGLTSPFLYKSIIYSCERKKAIAAVQESERKYSGLFHFAPQPMWVFDIESLHFLSVNEAAIKFYGYTREEFLLMTINDIKPSSGNDSIPEDLRPFNEKGQFIYLSNILHKKKNGELIRVDTRSNIINYNGKTVAFILAIDVTEKVNYIKTIEQQNEKMKEISRIQSDVIRAPLVKFMSLVNAFKLMKQNNAKQRKTSERILLSLRELDEVITEIIQKTEMIEEVRPSG